MGRIFSSACLRLLGLVRPQESSGAPRRCGPRRKTCARSGTARCLRPRIPRAFSRIFRRVGIGAHVHDRLRRVGPLHERGGSSRPDNPGLTVGQHAQRDDVPRRAFHRDLNLRCDHRLALGTVTMVPDRCSRPGCSPSIRTMHSTSPSRGPPRQRGEVASRRGSVRIPARATFMPSMSSGDWSRCAPAPRPAHLPVELQRRRRSTENTMMPGSGPRRGGKAVAEDRDVGADGGVDHRVEQLLELNSGSTRFIDGLPTVR